MSLIRDRHKRAIIGTNDGRLATIFIGADDRLRYVAQQAAVRSLEAEEDLAETPATVVHGLLRCGLMASIGLVLMHRLRKSALGRLLFGSG